MTEGTAVRRWVLFAPVSALLTICLFACQPPARGSAPAGSGFQMLASPANGSASALPTVAPFTIGAWPSNSMPGSSDQVTIYVICRVQNPTMMGPSMPATHLTVVVRALDPINRTAVGITSNDGIARVPVAFSGMHTGKPILVEVAATWHGVTYRGETSFTPAPQGQPTEPAPNETPKPGATPTATPQVGPPKPMPTPKPSPPPKPVATSTP
jgi:hypothetical protein